MAGFTRAVELDFARKREYARQAYRDRVAHARQDIPAVSASPATDTVFYVAVYLPATGREFRIYVHATDAAHAEARVRAEFQNRPDDYEIFPAEARPDFASGLMSPPDSRERQALTARAMLDSGRSV